MNTFRENREKKREKKGALGLLQPLGPLIACAGSIPIFQCSPMLFFAPLPAYKIQWSFRAFQRGSFLFPFFFSPLLFFSHYDLKFFLGHFSSQFGRRAQGDCTNAPPVFRYSSSRLLEGTSRYSDTFLYPQGQATRPRYGLL